LSDNTVDKVRTAGVAVVFISHNIRHALAVGDRFTVLNRGTTLGTAKRGEISSEELQKMMAGGEDLAKPDGSLGWTV
jgi:simple sugar transport system ATP-binding protein